MITVEDRARITPARSLPNGEFFYSPLGLFGFQADGVAQAYLETEPGTAGGVVVVFDAGLGKTVLGIGVAAYLFDDEKIDLCIVVCERNKIRDWHTEFENFSALSVHTYYGPGRQKRLEKVLAQGEVHVLVTTYETGRNELMSRMTNGRRGKGTKMDGPLFEALQLHTRRSLWLFDEGTRLGGRATQLHQSYDYALRELRKGPHHQRALSLTATPLERDMESSYNMGRIITPTTMPTVARFEADYTRGKDDFGRYQFRHDRKADFGAIFRQTMIRKRKTDLDVIDQFPAQVEKSIKVDLSPHHRELYSLVRSLLDPPEGQPDDRTPEQYAADERALFLALRLTAGHPAAHLRAQNRLSRIIAAEMGETLRAISSSKSDELVARLRPVIKGQGAQAVVFTFFANTVLPDLATDLRHAGYTVSTYSGAQSHDTNLAAEDEFKAGKTEILLTSDSGCRGLNLPNAEYVVEYESALTHAKRIQRINRIHRITSTKQLVTCYTMVALDTVEEGLVNLMLRRNEDHDILVGDEEDGTQFVSAAERRVLLDIARKR
jgi:SNF2 family DNA or RNA helicase